MSVPVLVERRCGPSHDQLDPPPVCGADCKGWPLESLEVGLRLQGQEERRIARTLTIAGLDDEQKVRLADIAERTPVTLTLKTGLPIDTRLG